MSDMTIPGKRDVILRLKSYGLSNADIKNIMSALKPELNNKANISLENVTDDDFKQKAEKAGVSGYKEITYDTIDSCSEPGIYYVSADDAKVGWLFVTEYSQQYEDEDGTYIGISTGQLYCGQDGQWKCRTAADGNWLPWKEIGTGNNSSDGAVKSVNRKTGDVVLKASDVGAYTKEETDAAIGSAISSGVTESKVQELIGHELTMFFYNHVDNKQDEPTVYTIPASSVDMFLQHNYEYHFVNDVVQLTLDAVSTDGYHSNFCFKSGEPATSLSYSAKSIIWVGDDCDADGDFVPEANTRYEVCVKKLGNDIVARVGAY